MAGLEVTTSGDVVVALVLLPPKCPAGSHVIFMYRPPSTVHGTPKHLSRRIHNERAFPRGSPCDFLPCPLARRGASRFDMALPSSDLAQGAGFRHAVSKKMIQSCPIDNFDHHHHHHHHAKPHPRHKARLIVFPLYPPPTRPCRRPMQTLQIETRSIGPAAVPCDPGSAQLDTTLFFWDGPALTLETRRLIFLFHGSQLYFVLYPILSIMVLRQVDSAGALKSSFQASLYSTQSVLRCARCRTFDV